MLLPVNSCLKGKSLHHVVAVCANNAKHSDSFGRFKHNLYPAQVFWLFIIVCGAACYRLYQNAHQLTQAVSLRTYLIPQKALQASPAVKSGSVDCLALSHDCLSLRLVCRWVATESCSFACCARHMGLPFWQPATRLTSIPPTCGLLSWTGACW